ncbi:MAG: hypothetical protein LUI06_04875 [Ruminococcus sp.]|nr:hypothetical protein [Ruminococcus sp.]
MGLVPKKTKAEFRIWRSITLTRVVGGILTLAISSQISDMLVYSKLNMVFIIFCCIIYIILSGSSPSDPTKKFAAAYLDWIRFLFSRKKIYREDKKDAKENKKIKH